MLPQQAEIPLRFFLSPIVEPWSYVSRTRQEGRKQPYYYCLSYPMATLAYLSVVPAAWPLFYGLSVVQAFNMIRTVKLEVVAHRPAEEKYDSRTTVIAYKRFYDELLKKPRDILLSAQGDIDEALKVVGDTRQQHVQDPTGQKVWYYVLEQYSYKGAYYFESEFQSARLLYDGLAIGATMVVCMMMRAPAALFMTDLQLFRQGRLSLFNVRTPLRNFFKAPDSLRKDKARVILTKKEDLKPPKKPHPTKL